MNTTPSILVGCHNKVVWIRVEGKGSFLNSGSVKEFANGMLNRGHREFVIDLAGCPVMDSTFMGTVTGIALRLRELGQGGVHVIHLNERNRDLLCNLGLNQLLTMDGIAAATDVAVQETLENKGDRAEQARTMLEAHEALVRADSGNLTKFKDVLEYLKQDLHDSE